MLHHVSFSVHEPRRAAATMSQFGLGRAVAAPAPPFPDGSWFVVRGDNVGSMIELTPWGSVLAPEAPGISSDPLMRPHSASHLLAGTPMTQDEVLAAAKGLGLYTAPVDTGLFQFTKVWIEGSLLLELLSPDQAAAYVTCFGAEGAAGLDARLRDLERALRERTSPTARVDSVRRVRRSASPPDRVPDDRT